MATPRRLTREERQRRVSGLAETQDGLAHRRQLNALGVSHADVRSEVRAGRWALRGRHTIHLGVALGPRAPWWTAVWESGGGAVLDGAAALVAHGLTGFFPVQIDVSLPRNNRRRHVNGTRLHLRSAMPPALSAGVPRVRPEVAAIHACGWSRSDREAALILCLVIQQRLTTPARLLEQWQTRAAKAVERPRRTTLDHIVLDVCDGAHSLGELDVGALCRRIGVPAPERQVVRTLPNGRIYLDARWKDHPLVVEVDGVQHTKGLAPIDDALRQNEVTLSNDRVLRIPVLGLRLRPDEFGSQLVRALGPRDMRADVATSCDNDTHPASGTEARPLLPRVVEVRGVEPLVE